MGLQLIQNLNSQQSKTAFLLTNTSFYDTQRDQGSVLVALPYQKQTESDTVSQIWTIFPVKITLFDKSKKFSITKKIVQNWRTV